MRHVLFVALALVACDNGVECGSTQGFVSGETLPGAAVYARPTDGGDRVEAEVQGDGSYELNLEGGLEWTIWAEADECFSDDHVVDVEACEEYERDIDINLDDCATADKPNLYLYPATPTPTTVRIEADPRQRIFRSEPAYEDGWSGVAHPDGTFEIGGQRYGYLFYEITLVPDHTRAAQREQGWCLRGDRAVQDMADLLVTYGFNEREREDFVDAWQAGFPVAEAITVYPQLQVDHMAGLHIEPALPVHRVWLLVQPGSTCAPVTEPSVQPFDRSVPHGMEWGVMLPR